MEKRRKSVKAQPGLAKFILRGRLQPQCDLRSRCVLWTRPRPCMHVTGLPNCITINSCQPLLVASATGKFGNSKKIKVPYIWCIFMQYTKMAIILAEPQKNDRLNMQWGILRRTQVLILMGSKLGRAAKKHHKKMPTCGEKLLVSVTIFHLTSKQLSVYVVKG